MKAVVTNSPSPPPRGVTQSPSRSPSLLCRLCTSWLIPGATQALEDRLLRLTQKMQWLHLCQAHHLHPRHRAQEPQRARYHLQEKPLHLPHFTLAPFSYLLPPLSQLSSHTPCFILVTTHASPSSTGMLSPTLATLPPSTSALAWSPPPEGIMPRLMTGGTSLQASSLPSYVVDNLSSNCLLHSSPLPPHVQILRKSLICALLLE